MGRRFFRPFFFGLGLFAVLIFLGDLFDKMHLLVKTKAPLTTILEYLWLQVPVWGIRVIPMATLLATLVALTGFIQSGEWIAAQSCGFKTSDFWKPLLLGAVLVSAGSFAAQETLLPLCQSRSKRLWREQIHPEWEWDKFYDVVLLVGDDRFLKARLFVPKDGYLERPVLDHLGPEGVDHQLDAKTAHWDGLTGRWVFHEGAERRWTGAGMAERIFDKHVSDLEEHPKTLTPRSKSPEEMSLLELLKALRSGAGRLSPRELRVAAHAKLAYPVTNLIICALGIPIALRLRRRGRVVSFCAALAVSFLYFWCQEMGRSLGLAGRLSPPTAAWLANAAFAAAAGVLIARTEG